MKNVTLWEQFQNPIEKIVLRGNIDTPNTQIHDRSQIHVPGLVQAFQ
jgi:hypothetical protein